MYASRGRAGPSKTTPANVQCQKCLKRGHYSYECSAKPQERPYVPRPSRTQQLLNPKLVPKLTNDVPDVLLRKKGVADEELAKKEAERQKKRELEEDDDEPIPQGPPARRGRSSSYDSVSTVSTRSPSPAPRRRHSPSPPPLESGSHREVTHSRSPSRSRSFSSEEEGPSRGPSGRNPANRHGSYGERQSPRLGHEGTSHRRHRDASSGRDPIPRRDRSGSSDRYRARPDHRQTRRVSSRSPSRSPPRESRQAQHQDARRYRDRDDRYQGSGGRRDGQRAQDRAPPPPPRERSLSPFSKRLALTQAMNLGK